MFLNGMRSLLSLPSTSAACLFVEILHLRTGALSLTVKFVAVSRGANACAQPAHHSIQTASTRTMRIVRAPPASARVMLPSPFRCRRVQPHNTCAVAGHVYTL
jgi:hypothetical protein